METVNEVSTAKSAREIAARAGPVGYALAVATRAHRAALQDRLRALGLHLGQELIVVDLHLHPGSTQAELVERLGIEQPTVAKALSRMERAGFVTRTRDKTDQRCIRVRLTSRGEDVVAPIAEAWSDVDAQTTKGLTARERRQLVAWLTAIVANYD